MKKDTKRMLVAASAAAVGCAVAAALAVRHNMLKKRKITLTEGFTLTAHTGCEGTKDNSLEAIQKGYESGADIVEFDVHFTKDGTPVLAHDGADDSTVTLDEAFALIRELEGLKVNVDCKTTINLKAIAETAEKHGVKDRIFYTGIGEKDIVAVKQQTPEIEYYLNTGVNAAKKNNEAYLNSLADKIISLGAVGINMHYRDCSKKLAEIMHKRGLKVSVWTLNKDSHMPRVVELGADNITTRKPTKVRAVIKAKTAE